MVRKLNSVRKASLITESEAEVVFLLQIKPEIWSFRRSIPILLLRGTLRILQP